MAFPSRETYEKLLYTLTETYPEIQSSTLKFYTNSPTSGIVKGSIIFQDSFELQVFEFLDFVDGELLS